MAASFISMTAAMYLNEVAIKGDEPSEQIPVYKIAKDPVQADRKTHSNVSGRVARIRMDSRGHFVTKAKMNGRSIEVLVDTGATSVAIDEKTARRLGIRLKNSDYKYEVATANGRVKAASAVIKKVQIGRVTVHDVKAAVLQGDGLDGTLLGMSFLGQLREFKIRDGELIMRQ